MCFSASASFLAAGTLSTIGFLTLRVASSPNLRLIATIPLTFALQQMLEGIVWVTLTTGHLHGITHKIGVYGFLFFAGIFWPIWIPWIFSQLEQNLNRKRILQGNLCIGILIAALAAFMMMAIGNQAEISTHHITYFLRAGAFEHYLSSYGERGYLVLLGFYLLPTVGSSFISTIPNIWILGVLTGTGFIIAQIFYAYALGSVWCFFAAIISMVCYFIVRKSADTYKD